MGIDSNTRNVIENFNLYDARYFVQSQGMLLAFLVPLTLVMFVVGFFTGNAHEASENLYKLLVHCATQRYLIIMYVKWYGLRNVLSLRDLYLVLSFLATLCLIILR